jgi:hypothetical protein
MASVLYTEEGLATWIRDAVLRHIANELGWTDISAAGPYATIVEDVVREYPGSTGDIASCSNVVIVTALARVKVWTAVAAETLADYDINEGAVQLKRGDIHKNALKMLEIAERQYRSVLATVDDTSSGQTQNVNRSGYVPVKVVY